MSLVSAVAFTNCSLPSATLANTGDCHDVELIFARGSGEPLNAENYQSWHTALETILAKSTLSYNFYELGSSADNNASYPAADIGLDSFQTIITTVSATLSSLRLGEFNQSVQQGVTELTEHIKSVSTECPNTKFVLGGYSQGAMLISRSLSYLDSSKIAFAATFGDPTLYLPEGHGINPPACRGAWFSDYRLYAPNCHAHSGLLGANKNYQPKGYAGKVGLWCNEKDIFCSKLIDLSNPIGDHIAYASSNLYLDAAKYIGNQLASLFPDKIESTDKKVAKRNVAIVIDTTSSMKPKIEAFKNTAAEIAKTTLDDHGEIALFEYRDLLLDFQPRIIVDYGCTYEEFMTALNSIEVDTADSFDPPESALSAILYSLNRLEWKRGATKSIVLLTDAFYHSPDIDKTYLQDVIQRSLEIDPVNIYVATTDAIKPDYAELTEKTSGATFSLENKDELIAMLTKVLYRPSAAFELDEYSGKVGDKFHFRLKLDTTDISGYRFAWDTDNNGFYDHWTSTPDLKITYDAPRSSFVQVRITTPNQLVSTASARIKVEAKDAKPPELTNLNYQVHNNQLVISHQTANLAGVILTINDAPLGIINNTQIILDGYHGEALTIQLTPISQQGLLGDSYQLDIPGTAIYAPPDQSAQGTSSNLQITVPDTITSQTQSVLPQPKLNDTSSQQPALTTQYLLTPVIESASPLPKIISQLERKSTSNFATTNLDVSNASKPSPIRILVPNSGGHD